MPKFPLAPEIQQKLTGYGVALSACLSVSTPASALPIPVITLDQTINASNDSYYLNLNYNSQDYTLFHFRFLSYASSIGSGLTYQNKALDVIAPDPTNQASGHLVPQAASWRGGNSGAFFGTTYYLAKGASTMPSGVSVQNYMHGFPFETDPRWGTRDLAAANQEFQGGNLAFSLDGDLTGKFRGPLFEFSESKYLALRFTIDENTHYGWMEVQTKGASELKLLSWSYNSTPGEDILVGTTAVPEPSATISGLALLALGAAGIQRLRKSRSVQG